MSDPVQHLQDAIDRNKPAAVTLVTDAFERFGRSRFLAGNPEQGVWIGVPSGHGEVIDAMAAAGTLVRVTFKSLQSHVELTSTILEHKTDFQLNADTQIDAVRLAWPAKIAIVQRRSAYRVAVAQFSDVRLRFYRVAEKADLLASPAEGSELHIDVRDFSNSGVGGIWKRQRGEDPVLASNQRLRVDVITPYTTIHLEAHARFVAALPEPEYRRIGIQFMFRPTNLVDRTNLGLLNRITGELQRAELKRLRTAR